MNFVGILAFITLHQAVAYGMPGNGFSKDGEITKFLENVPVVGYGVSAVHAIAGNEEHAKRAAAKCTTSSFAGPAGGVGGAALGGIIGGAVGSAVGVAAQAGIAENHIQNDRIRNECANHSAGNYASGIGFGAAGGLMGCTAGSVVSQLATQAGKSALVSGTSGFIASTGVGSAFSSVPDSFISQDAKNRA